MSQWVLKEKNGVSWLENPLWTISGQVKQGFTCRWQKAGDGIETAFNLSTTSDPSRGDVLERRRQLMWALGADPASWMQVKQVHGTNLIKVTAQTKIPGIHGNCLQEADGIMTNQSGVTLVTFHADCLPLYFWDPIRGVIALSHAGWKGTVQDMAGKTIRGMIEAYGCRPQEIKAAIGPGAGVCHYEVDLPVFEAAQGHIAAKDFARTMKNAGKKNRWWFDMALYNQCLMELHGLKRENIVSSQTCTICHHGLFFSHRLGDEGRQCAFLHLEIEK